MLSIDLLSSLAAFGLLALAALCYLVRLWLSGHAHFARVNAAGGSPLLGLGAMEFGYWCLQPFGRACIRLGLSPNQITGTSLLFGALGGAAIACGKYGLGALLASLSALGDVLDGLVARETRRSNPGGAIFDASVDRYTEFFVLGGIAFSARANGVVLALALLALLGSFMISYGSAKAEALRVEVPRGMMRRAERATYLCLGLLLSPVALALVAQGTIPAWSAHLPLLAVLILVACVSNVSAVLRLQTVARSTHSVSLHAPPADAKVALSVVPNMVMLDDSAVLGQTALTAQALATQPTSAAAQSPLRMSRPAQR